MNLFELAVARKLSGGSGGGGGSSDLSLATITFHMTNYEDGFAGNAAKIPIVLDYNGAKYIKVDYPVLESETVTYDVPASDGGLLVAVDDFISVTGNATTVGSDILVTGDCTINYEGYGGGN